MKFIMLVLIITNSMIGGTIIRTWAEINHYDRKNKLENDLRIYKTYQKTNMKRKNFNKLKHWKKMDCINTNKSVSGKKEELIFRKGYKCLIEIEFRDY